MHHKFTLSKELDMLIRIILLTMLFISNCYANYQQWGTEAINNIMHISNQDTDQYFSRIEKYFTKEAFVVFKESFNKTNVPLIKELKLTMSNKNLVPLSQLKDNNHKLQGEYELIFQGADLSLSQKLKVQIAVTEGKDSYMIDSLTFDKIGDAQIKMKNLEQAMMCKKRKEASTP